MVLIAIVLSCVAAVVSLGNLWFARQRYLASERRLADSRVRLVALPSPPRRTTARASRS